MPVPVYLDFVPPNDLPNLTKLRIYEGPTPDGPFAEIELVTPVGEQGSYLSQYTTVLAVSANDWFSLRWENAQGALTDYTEAVQGSALSIVAEITSRVLLRAPYANEEVVAQEAEAVVEEMFGNTNPDPAIVKKRTITGMTLLTLARLQLVDLTRSSNISSWTAGLVSMKSGNTQTLDNVRALLREAQRMLGLNMSVVARMATPEIAGGLSEVVSADISRLLIEVE